MDRSKTNNIKGKRPASNSRIQQDNPLQLLRRRLTIETMLTTKFAIATGLAGAAFVASLVPLLSLTNGASLGPPYTLDEAVQLVQTEISGTVVRAETLPANNGITTRGVPAAGTNQDECSCAEDEAEGNAEDALPESTKGQNNVQSRGVTETSSVQIHSIRILRPDGTVSTILVDEQQGIIAPRNTEQEIPEKTPTQPPEPESD